MAFILKALEALGKITFCLLPEINLKRTHCWPARCLRDILLRVLYILFLVTGLIEFADTAFNNSRDILTGTSNLSELLGFYCQYGGVHCSNFLIRAVGIVFDQEIKSLILVLLESKNYYSALYVKDGLWMGACMLIFVSIAGGYGYALILINLTFTLFPEYKLRVIPIKFFRNYTVHTSVTTVAAILFASTFFIVIGTHLRLWLDGYSKKFHGLLLPDGSFRVTSKVHARMAVRMAELKAEFVSLRKAFEDFGRVGGLYALILLVNFTLLIIRFLSSESIPVKSVIVFSDEAKYFCYFLPFGITVIGMMGSMLATSVFRHRILMADLMVQIPSPFRPPELTDLLNWQSSWTWRLTAVGLFDIKASLIPAVAATIITYFIFLFQLRASEFRNYTE